MKEAHGEWTWKVDGDLRVDHLDFAITVSHKKNTGLNLRWSNDMELSSIMGTLGWYWCSATSEPWGVKTEPNRECHQYTHPVGRTLARWGTDYIPPQKVTSWGLQNWLATMELNPSMAPIQHTALFHRWSSTKTALNVALSLGRKV